MKIFATALLLIASSPVAAEDWQYLAITSDGRYLSDDDTFRLIGTGEHDDYSVDVHIKNVDTNETFRVAIGLTDCLQYENGSMLLFQSDGLPKQVSWDSKKHGAFDLAGAKLCRWAKTQVTVSDAPSN